MDKPVLVVLAAGMGSRYGGLKQIDPVGSHGEAILDYSLFDAHEAGFETAVIIIKDMIKKDFMDTVGKRLEKCPMEIRYAYQELDKLPAGYSVPADRVKPWGTSQCLLCAQEVIDGAPFAVINADDYYGKDAFKVIYEYLCNAKNTDKLDCCMVGYLLHNTVTENGSVARGICQVVDGYLTDVVERTKIVKKGADAAFTEDDTNWQELSGDVPVSMNCWGFSPSMLEELYSRFPAWLDVNVPVNPLKCEYFLPFVANSVIKEGCGKVRVLNCHETWHGITYKEDMENVVSAIAKMRADGLYPETLLD